MMYKTTLNSNIIFSPIGAYATMIEIVSFYLEGPDQSVKGFRVDIIDFNTKSQVDTIRLHHNRMILHNLCPHNLCPPENFVEVYYVHMKNVEV